MIVQHNVYNKRFRCQNRRVLEERKLLDTQSLVKIMIVGDLEYWLVWILNGKKRDWFCKWSGFLMGSEIWKPNYLKSGQMATISSKTIWDPDKNVWLLNDLFLQHWTTLFHGNHFCQFIQLLHCTNVCLWRYARTLFRRAIYWWHHETHYAHNIHRPILGVYLDKLAKVQVVPNCRYSKVIQHWYSSIRKQSYHYLVWPLALHHNDSISRVV